MVRTGTGSNRSYLHGFGVIIMKHCHWLTAGVCTLHALALWVVLLALLQMISHKSAPAVAAPKCVVTARVLYSHRVVLPSGVESAFVHIDDDGFIRFVKRGTSLPDAVTYALEKGIHLEDLSGFTISPGLIDTHVHISAVGGRRWEGYATATRAAAAGGVTSIIGMPLNSLPPTVNVEALELELAQAREWYHAVPSRRCI